MSTGLRTQLHDYFEYVDETQDVVDVATVRERRVGTGWVRPVEPRTPRRRVPVVVWVAAAVAVVAAVLVPLLFFVDRSAEPDVATTVPGTTVTTLVSEVSVTPTSEPTGASAPRVWDLPSFTEAGWEWVATDVPWPAYEFGRLADGTWVAYSTGTNCSSNGEYYLGRPGGAGDTTTGCWGEPVGDPVETIYFSDDGRTWQSQVVDLWETPATYSLWFGEHLIVGPTDPTDPTGWLAFNGSDWEEIAGPNALAQSLNLGSLASFLEYHDQALLVFWSQYLFDTDPRVPVNDLAFVAFDNFGVTPADGPDQTEGWGFSVQFAQLENSDGIVGDTVKDRCPAEEPYCGLVNIGGPDGPFASMVSGDRPIDAFNTFRENLHSSIFMFDGQWHVIEWLAEGGPALWRTGNLNDWVRLGSITGLPVPGSLGFPSGIEEFDGHLISWANDEFGGGRYAVSDDGLHWRDLDVPMGFGDSIPGPGTVAVVDGWLILDLNELSPIATRDLETWYRVDNPFGRGTTSVGLLGDYDGAPANRVLGATIDAGDGSNPTRWVAIPPGE